MQRLPIESSKNIHSAGYDPSSATLEVCFRDKKKEDGEGAVWQYAPFPEPKFREMLAAESVGSYFAQNVRNNPDVKGVRVDD